MKKALSRWAHNFLYLIGCAIGVIVIVGVTCGLPIVAAGYLGEWAGFTVFVIEGFAFIAAFMD